MKFLTITNVFYATVGVCLVLILRELNLIRKENAKQYMLTQKQADELTQQLNDSKADVTETLKNESEQVQAAIRSGQVDTTALEQAISNAVANNAQLKSDIEKIYEPEVIENLPAPSEETPNAPAEVPAEVPSETPATNLGGFTEPETPVTETSESNPGEGLAKPEESDDE